LRHVCVVRCTPLHRHAHPFPTRLSSDLTGTVHDDRLSIGERVGQWLEAVREIDRHVSVAPCSVRNENVFQYARGESADGQAPGRDRKSTRMKSSHVSVSFAVCCCKENSK